MLEHLVKAREQGGAGPDGQRASGSRNEDSAKRNNGLEVRAWHSQGFVAEARAGGGPYLYYASRVERMQRDFCHLVPCRRTRELGTLRSLPKTTSLPLKRLLLWSISLTRTVPLFCTAF